MPSLHQPPDDFEPIGFEPQSHDVSISEDSVAALLLDELRTCEDAAEKMEAELRRLRKVESAALRVLASMPRRNGKPSSFTMQTFHLIEELDATLQQDEGDE